MLVNGNDDLGKSRSMRSNSLSHSAYASFGMLPAPAMATEVGRRWCGEVDQDSLRSDVGHEDDTGTP
jgi:hypothetical protein